jgi:single-stranded DNA-binding protein
MTALALITGTLYRAPERRVSKAGKSFVTATVKTRDGDAAAFWRLTAFSESCQEELMQLREGDAVSAQGAMRAELYTPEGGEPRVSLSMVADQVLPARGRAKPRKDDAKPAQAAPPAQRRRSTAEMAANGGDRYAPAPRHWGGDGRAEPSLNDDIPF